MAGTALDDAPLRDLARGTLLAATTPVPPGWDRALLLS
ncbi:hypothetical protein P3T27_005989 [Kitasatospora sp. MAA19]|nr:hypothetical protein [Kitasatospora sp. MAA19]